VYAGSSEYRRRLIGIDCMFLDFCNDDRTALNSKAPTKLGRMGLPVLRLSPGLGRLIRMLLLISASQWSRVASSSSGSMSSRIRGNGLPPLSNAAKSSADTPREMVEAVLLRRGGPFSSSSWYGSGSASSDPGT